MNLIVNTGEKEKLHFKNSKIKVIGSAGLHHTGSIDLCGKTIQQTQRDVSNNQVSKNIKKIYIDNSMSKQLKSGMKVSVSDCGFPNLYFQIGANWTYKSSPFDIDFSFFLADNTGLVREEDFIFYNNPQTPEGSIKLDIDKSIDIANNFNASAQINLNKVPDYISSISITATIFDEKRKFGELLSGSIHFITHDNKETLELSFADHLTNENAIVISELYRHNGTWKIKGVAQGFFGGLEALCKNFKIETM